MGRYQQQEAIAEVCATEWQREESARERAVPTYSELLDQLATAIRERDEWKDAYMELVKLTHVPEC